MSAILHEDWQHIRLELLQFSSGRAQAPNLACLHEQTQCSSFSAVRFQPQIRAYQSLISPAARQRLEKASHRHDELCQQLSGKQQALGSQHLRNQMRSQVYAPETELMPREELQTAQVDSPERKTETRAPRHHYNHHADLHPSRQSMSIAPLWALPHKQMRSMKDRACAQVKQLGAWASRN